MIIIIRINKKNWNFIYLPKWIEKKMYINNKKTSCWLIFNRKFIKIDKLKNIYKNTLKPAKKNPQQKQKVMNDEVYI